MKAVAYIEPMKVEVQDIEYPGLELKDGPGVNPANVGRQCPHGVILQLRLHQHLRLRPAHGPGPHHRAAGLILGHEITGEVVEVGRDVEFIKQGDLCSVPFNIACGRCRMCKEGHTGVCLNVNPERPGSAYGYVDMGGWQGGQAEYVMVPYADWNLLQFPDSDQAMEKILDLTMLSDIFPTGYHGCVTAGVTTGSTVYIAGAGPVGLAAAASAQLLGAAGGHRRRHERRSAWPTRGTLSGAETVDLTEDGSLPETDRADRRRTRGRRRGRRGGLRGPRAWQGRRRGARPPSSTRSWR